MSITITLKSVTHIAASNKMVTVGSGKITDGFSSLKGKINIPFDVCANIFQDGNIGDPRVWVKGWGTYEKKVGDKTSKEISKIQVYLDKETVEDCKKILDVDKLMSTLEGMEEDTIVYMDRKLNITEKEENKNNLIMSKLARLNSISIVKKTDTRIDPKATAANLKAEFEAQRGGKK